ncbi:MAG: hypothetical protein K9J13_16150 [Saprospiraceae bacterium]|nr:hypothetical protein [Saprospiraceae bacterium]
MEGIDPKTIDREFGNNLTRISPMHYDQQGRPQLLNLDPHIIFPTFTKQGSIHLYGKNTLYGPTAFLKLNFNIPPGSLEEEKTIQLISHIDAQWIAYLKRAREWWGKIKPNLVNNSPTNPNITRVGFGMSIKNPTLTKTVPRDIPSPYVQQRLFDFKDWLIFSELPII